MIDKRTQEIEELTKLEQQAKTDFKVLVRKAINSATIIHRWGDGHGGYLRELFEEAMVEILGDEPKNENKTSKKKKIASNIRKAVFERDKYRCVNCGTHLNLSVDHILAESEGGTLNMNNLQTLCIDCNRSKGTKSMKDWQSSTKQ